MPLNQTNYDTFKSQSESFSKISHFFTITIMPTYNKDKIDYQTLWIQITLKPNAAAALKRQELSALLFRDNIIEDNSDNNSTKTISVSDSDSFNKIFELIT